VPHTTRGRRLGPEGYIEARQSLAVSWLSGEALLALPAFTGITNSTWSAVSHKSAGFVF